MALSPIREKYTLQRVTKTGEMLLRNRKIHRALRKAGFSREELIERRDYCGIRDPTPYEAVKIIIKQERKAAGKRLDHSRFA